MKRITFKRGSGLLILAAVFLLAVNATLGFLLTRQSSSALISLIQSRMLDISKTAADMLDGDVLSGLTAQDADTEEYQQIMETLTHFQDNIDMEYIYCIQDLGDRQFAFSVDPTVGDPGVFGEPIVYTDALYRASLGESAVDNTSYTDAWGRFYSAYSPVFTSAGTVGGIVAVDFSAAWYDDQVFRLVRTVVAVGIFSMVAGILIVIIISQRNAERYRRLYGQLNGLSGKVQELMRVAGFGAGEAVPAGSSSGEEYKQGDDIDALDAKVLSMQDEIRESIGLIQAQSNADTLTGLANVNAYVDATRRVDRRIAEGSASFALVVLDLNGLKAINDRHGREAGDRALTDTAQLLKTVFGRDNLYRIDADEFVALLDDTSGEALSVLLDRFDGELVQANRSDASRPYTLSVSKGSAVFDPREDQDYKSVFKRADIAMYDDKTAYYTAKDNEES